MTASVQKKESAATPTPTPTPAPKAKAKADTKTGRRSLVLRAFDATAAALDNQTAFYALGGLMALTATAIWLLIGFNYWR